jgi:hypothetical protein|nr:MAG TPA: hypothetical protein [Caudoviricetes sp.]
MNTKNLKIGTTIVTILGLGVNLALNWLEEKEREVMKQEIKEEIITELNSENEDEEES